VMTGKWAGQYPGLEAVFGPNGKGPASAIMLFGKIKNSLTARADFE
jgi:hypothetical protein